MKIRRVVTGHTPDGTATVASDTGVDPITATLFPGLELYQFWGADYTPTFPDNGSPHLFRSYFPPAGGFRFAIATIPPDSVTPATPIDLETAIPEAEEKLPSVLAHFEPDHPGMHRTDTIDFEYIISGEVWLELDNGVEVHLRAGDTVVQNGTRHAWRNKSSEPCQMITIIVGAHRK